ncbi:hypothetical protein CDD83_4883 [Cordyceps sp. RAO-2017]|nr:hypothetical protein CDD83_4883 [Cordyceps sp. RAO-2017]
MPVAAPLAVRRRRSCTCDDVLGVGATALQPAAAAPWAEPSARRAICLGLSEPWAVIRQPYYLGRLFTHPLRLIMTYLAAEGEGAAGAGGRERPTAAESGRWVRARESVPSLAVDGILYRTILEYIWGTASKPIPSGLVNRELCF